MQAALILRDTIKYGTGIRDVTQTWPPNPHDLTDTFELPDCLNKFLKVVLGGEQSQTVPSDRVNRLVWSLGQDIVSAVTNAQVLTPKHMLLPWVIKTIDWQCRIDPDTTGVSVCTNSPMKL